MRGRSTILLGLALSLPIILVFDDVTLTVHKHLHAISEVSAILSSDNLVFLVILFKLLMFTASHILN